MRKDFAFFFATTAAFSQLLRGLLGNYLLLSELNNAHIIRRVLFSTIIFIG